MCRQLSQQAIARMEADQWQEAEGLLDQAVTACPIDPDARRYYAETLLHRGASAEALAHLEKAIRLTPNDTSKQSKFEVASKLRIVLADLKSQLRPT